MCWVSEAQPPVFLALCLRTAGDLCCCHLCCVGVPFCLYWRSFPWVRNSHLTMFTENYFVHRVFQARALHQPCVATVCVSCHSVHTNLFKVPCGCCTCKNFLFPSVMCPQCPVFRVLFHCSTLIFIVPPRRPHPGPRSLIVPQHRWHQLSSLVCFSSIKEDILSPWLWDRVTRFV